MAKKKHDELNRIKEVAKAKGVTQEYIAKKMKVGTLTVAAWYQNRQHPALADLNRLAKVLEVDVCDLLNR